MSALFLYDDAAARQFEPYSLTRPVGELRAGALLLRERWAHATGREVAGHLSSPHLHDFAEPGSPTAPLPLILPAGSIVANARFAPALAALSPGAECWSCEGRLVAVRLSSPLPVDHFTAGAVALESLAEGRQPASASGWWLHHVWDLVRHLGDMLRQDIPGIAATLDLVPVQGVVVGDPELVHVERGATVEPLVVLDTTAGPILIRRGAVVSAFTRLVGPCAIGVESHVLGGKVATCAVGEVCRVHGELSSTIFVGHANKGHDGFVGHSILGRWSNLGASTVTSNLKNTYGSVQLWTPAGVRDTGLQFLGTLLGDHAKTAVGTRLMTGTVVGTAANVVSDALPPKVVAPFTFGDGTYRLDKFLEVAARVMARRHVALGERERRWLTAVFHARWTVGA